MSLFVHISGRHIVDNEPPIRTKKKRTRCTRNLAHTPRMHYIVYIHMYYVIQYAPYSVVVVAVERRRRRASSSCAVRFRVDPIEYTSALGVHRWS